MKIAKKTLSIVAIVTLVVAVGMLLLSLFGVKGIFDYPLVAILETAGIICVGSAFSLNALIIYPKKKNLAIVDLSLLGSLTLLSIIVFWIKAASDSPFGKIVLVLGLATIFFNIIISNYLKLAKNKLVLQIITYCLIVVLDVLLTLQIVGLRLFAMDWFLKMFIALCLVTFVLLIVLVILAKKVPQAENSTTSVVKELKENYIQIEKKEYEELKQRIQELEKELEDLKNK